MHLDALADLRIRVFREFPYLYEGTLAYERRYLESYARSERATIVLAHVEGEVVGAATAMPLTEHGEDVALPLTRGGLSPDEVYYFGESVLLPAYRGRGIGHAFFDARERAAREHGFTVCAFCAVVRPHDHPARPASYRPHDAFWTKRGYEKRPDLVSHFAWRDVGEASETDKPMVFWVKRLDRDGALLGAARAPAE